MLFDNSTQAAGLVAFLFTCGCCLALGRMGRWLWIAIIYFALTIEMIVETRHGLRLLVNGVMQHYGLYADRSEFQFVIAGLLVILVMAGLHQINGRGILTASSLAEKLAWMATLLLLLVFAFEFVSVHAIDGFLYQMAGGLMRIAWFWLALAGITAISAISQVWKAGVFRSDPGGTETD